MLHRILAGTPAGDSMSATLTAEGEFDLLIRAHQRRIYRIIFLHVRDADAADTLTQECFLRAFQQRSSFRGESSPATWLIRIAVNLARDHLKNRRLAFWRRLIRGETQPDAGSDAGPTPERILLAREDVAAVWAAVERLPSRQRSVFLLRFAEDLSIDEIAHSLALRPGTVKSHLSRALSTVRTRVGVDHEP
jgi:RNA polymerase sigma-70 factor (ECF subfamily)